MKFIIFASLLVVAFSASFLEEQGSKFQAFKLKHGKTYLNQAEETKRFNIFVDNLRSIEEHNALYEQGLVSYKQDINQFADMTQEEFRSMLTLSASNKPTIQGTPYVPSGLAVPASVDWRQQGQVTEVKDQGSCRSCWTFSLTGSTEAAYYRKTGKLVSLSEQQLVDCTTSVNYGCIGGYLEENFPYIKSTGLQSEDSYPYTGRDGRCQFDSSKVVTKITNYTVLPSGDESSLLDAVANVGPVSVAMYADYLSSYSEGIFETDLCSPFYLNHAVLVVGYGSENGQDYWIVKNSWGTSWGEQGYLRIVRGKNHCGIAQDTAYPTV